RGPAASALVDVLRAVAACDDVTVVGVDRLEVTTVLCDVGARLGHRLAVVAVEHVLGATDPHAVADLAHCLLVAGAPTGDVREVDRPRDHAGVARPEGTCAQRRVLPVAQPEVAAGVEPISSVG